MLNSHKLIANLTWVISRKDIENQFTIWFALTHWGRVTHICVGKLTIIGSDNGLSPGRRQAIIRTNAGILLIGTLGTNSSKILSEIRTFSFKLMHLKMSSGRRPFCLGLNVLMDTLPLLNAIHMLFEDYLLLPFPFVLKGSVAHRSRSQDIRVPSRGGFGGLNPHQNHLDPHFIWPWVQWTLCIDLSQAGSNFSYGVLKSLVCWWPHSSFVLYNAPE